MPWPKSASLSRWSVTNSSSTSEIDASNSDVAHHLVAPEHLLELGPRRRVAGPAVARRPCAAGSASRRRGPRRRRSPSISFSAEAQRPQLGAASGRGPSTARTPCRRRTAPTAAGRRHRPPARACAARRSLMTCLVEQPDDVRARADHEPLVRRTGVSSVHAPPSRSRASSTSTDRPARARYAAQVSPLWPPPTTTTSQLPRGQVGDRRRAARPCRAARRCRVLAHRAPSCSVGLGAERVVGGLGDQRGPGVVGPAQPGVRARHPADELVDAVLLGRERAGHRARAWRARAAPTRRPPSPGGW